MEYPIKEFNNNFTKEKIKKELMEARDSKKVNDKIVDFDSMIIRN